MAGVRAVLVKKIIISSGTKENSILMPEESTRVTG